MWSRIFFHLAPAPQPWLNTQQNIFVETFHVTIKSRLKLTAIANRTQKPVLMKNGQVTEMGRMIRRRRNRPFPPTATICKKWFPSVGLSARFSDRISVVSSDPISDCKRVGYIGGNINILSDGNIRLFPTT